MNKNGAVVVLIGLDDTDNLESCGTGFHARAICSELEQQGLATRGYITRHQLLVSPLVPYTSHNSSACVRVTARIADLQHIRAYCRDYLVRNSAEGSDAGLCVVPESEVDTAMQRFAYLCKRRVVTQQQARDIAAARQIYLEGLTGTQDGVIGALAAAGLHASGNDGRLLWINGLRELVDQTVALGDLVARTGVKLVQNMEGALLSDPALSIAMGPWPRAVLLGGEPVLIVEKATEGDEHDAWRVADKQYLKQF